MSAIDRIDITVGVVLGLALWSLGGIMAAEWTGIDVWLSAVVGLTIGVGFTALLLLGTWRLIRSGSARFDPNRAHWRCFLAALYVCVSIWSNIYLQPLLAEQNLNGWLPALYTWCALTGITAFVLVILNGRAGFQQLLRATNPPEKRAQ